MDVPSVREALQAVLVKPRPARRGYVVLAVLVVLIFVTGMTGLHLPFLTVLAVFTGLLAVILIAQAWRHGPVNREVRRRR